ncbi:COG1 [Bugula neritina]|uniref:Conserved oligomeric Golgi complex subunit 1 n=1 Tax=Bugula neritina TaxID=10212 RepID=A0A7J7KFB9_BUGNE|nr:COG1 [Bugula neritina]
MKEQMSYVTTIKSMTSLKDTVWTLYTQDKRMKCWSEVCSQLFSRPVNLWLDELSPLFSSRVKEIIAEHFHSILSATSNQLDKSKELMLSDPHMNSDTLRSSLNKEVDMSSFIWCESANDLPAADAWVSSAHKTFEEGGGLLMKANGNQEEISAATAEVISREAHEAICSLSNLVAQEIEAVSIPDDSSFSSKHCSSFCSSTCPSLEY